MDPLEKFRKQLLKTYENSGTTWISPEGKVFPFRDALWHSEMAKKILNLLPDPSCSSDAVAAGQRATYADWSECEPNELLKRGWIRQRDCWFSVWNGDKQQLENVWLGAVRKKCGPPWTRIRVNVGMGKRDGTLYFSTPQEILEHNEGLRGLRRRRRAASKGKKRSR
jgi:hypothetical protein